MLALVMALALGAQQQQTTTCRRVYNQVVCDTTTFPVPNTIPPLSPRLDGYSGALGVTPSYQESELKRQRSRAPSRAILPCEELALTALRAGNAYLAQSFLNNCD